MTDDAADGLSSARLMHVRNPIRWTFDCNSGGAMPKPLVLLTDPDASVVERNLDPLRLECGRGFEVVAFNSAEDSLRFLEQTHGGSRRVALLLTNEDAEEVDRLEFIERSRELFPEAKHILYTAREEIAGAMRGEVDCCLFAPWEAAEVLLYPMIREQLDEWEKSAPQPFDAVQVIGFQWSPRTHEVKDFLARNRIVYRWIDVESDKRMPGLDPASIDRARLPILLFPDGGRLDQPSNEEIAEKLGFRTEAELPFYDLVIVGGGPAGLASAVYGASEGLRTVIVERHAPGGQAGTSAFIENYLGFPDGLTGAELTKRAVDQARGFGVELLVPKQAIGLEERGPYRVIHLDDDTELVCYAVLISTGVTYRKLEAENAERLQGAGLYYGAATAEASRYRGQNVCIVGGGNSAGQVAMLLARYAAEVIMVTVDESLEKTMSKYLVERIESTENIRVLPKTTIVRVEGETKVEAVVAKNVDSGEEQTIETTGLFVWIGAKPHTEWLSDSIERDEDGFILTGQDLIDRNVRGSWDGRGPMPLESSMAGVFVAGDVRHASVKRIGSAVGEGSMAVQFIHQYLRDW